MGGDGRGGPGAEELCAYLRALAMPNRLELLRKLRVPQAAGDIELRPVRRDRGRRADRRLSRQAVETHLRTLERVGLVHGLDGNGHGPRYVLNPERLRAVAEELRALSLAPMLDAAPPALLALSGALEGRSFPLGDAGPWLLGSGPGSALPLDAAEGVLAAHARLVPAGGALHLEPLGEAARAATRLNGQPLPGAAAPLREGDVLALGRALLAVRGG